VFVFPAIDIIGGKAVRLLQGDYRRMTVYNDDVVAQATHFVEQGAEWLHLVDLDGARSGQPVNTDSISAIASALPNLAIQVGGGIRTLEVAQRVLDAGASRIILGSALVGDEALVDEMVAALGAERIVAGIDAHDGKVAIEGWRKGTAVEAGALAGELQDRGIRHMVFTDIARDGAQTGIDVAMYRHMATCAGFPVIVSGGVTALADIAKVRALGAKVAEGVIIGRALYEGNFTVAEAIETLNNTCEDETENREARGTV